MQAGLVGVGVTTQRLLGDIERLLGADVYMFVPPHPLVPVSDCIVYTIVWHSPTAPTTAGMPLRLR